MNEALIIIFLSPVVLSHDDCMVMLKPGSLGKAYFTGGGYSRTYYASRFHLHWGETNDHGSDHSVEGNFYAAALHFGHYNSKYSDILTSTNYPDGLSGLAIFFELAEDDNPDLEPYINALQDIPYKGNQTAFSTSFDKFFPDDMSKFYRYNGSMPLPPCNETVVWTLFKHLSTISSAQLDRLRTSLYDPDPSSNVASNNRPTQPLNGRTVERNFNDDDSSSSSSSSSSEET